jgi:hypothetical protein
MSDRAFLNGVSVKPMDSRNKPRSVQERIVREIRSLRAMRRELETEPRRVLTGTKGETPDTAKDVPTGHRASSRPYRDVKTQDFKVSR